MDDEREMMKGYFVGGRGDAARLVETYPVAEKMMLVQSGGSDELIRLIRNGGATLTKRSVFIPTTRVTKWAEHQTLRSTSYYVCSLIKNIRLFYKLFKLVIL